MLHESIRAITMLKELELSQTEISILPNYIGDLINLVWLDLSQTRVSTLLESIGSFKELRLLKIKNKSISAP